MVNKDDFPQPTIGECMVCEARTEVHEVCMNCIKHNEDWSECRCKDCGHTWNASKTEHFNISFCNSCHGTNIGGKYYEQEDKWSDVYDAFHTAIEESALQVTNEYHDLEEETHTLAEECKRIHDVMMQRDELAKAAKHLLDLYDNPIVTTETKSWSKQISLAYEDLRNAIKVC